MSYLQSRGAVWWFRLRLPKGLAKQPVPAWWPVDAASLAGTKGLFRTEIAFSLNTKDYPVAKRRGALEFARHTELFADAKVMLERGGTITQSDVDAFAHELHRKRLEHDDRERDEPRGVTITREALPGGGFRQAIMMPVPNASPRKREMTDADLTLIQDRAERELDAARRALAKRGLPDDGTTLGNAAVDRQLTDFLLARGVKEPHRITDEERRAFRLAAAEATKGSALAVLQRNAGELIYTPAADASPGGAVGPRLKEALKQWSAGIPSKGIRPPRPNGITEATLAVRWFTELHGDMHVSAIKRDHVRRYREALAQVPPKLSAKQRATKLPQLLKTIPADASGRSAGSIAKHLNLLSAVISFTAAEHDFKDRIAGWSNPVAGQQPRPHATGDGGTISRLPFELDDLRAIFASDAVTGAKRPAAAFGDAAKFVPLIGLFAGLRLDEIGQLHVRDLRKHPACGVWLIDVNEDVPGKRLKKVRGRPSGAKRLVPIHAELIACGLLQHHAKRLEEAGPDAILFPGFAPNSAGTWTARWSQWFGRFLRKEAKITDSGKVFHCFRHTFNDACRDAEIHDEDRHALIGHKIAGVNARYGEGPWFKTLDAKLQRLMREGRYMELDLSHLHVNHER